MAVVTRYRYDRDSITRALDLHFDRGLISDWRNHPDRAEGFVVRLTNGEDYELRSMREAHVFVHALGSAAQARTGKEG